LVLLNVRGLGADVNVSAHQAVAFVMIEDDATVLHVEFLEKRAQTS
jgi:hypothetical protein